MYEYRAIITSVHDADTMRADIDLGFAVWIKDQSLRLLGIQAPELYTPAGKAAQGFIRAKLPVGTEVVVHTVKDKREKYGRMLADVFCDGVHINKLLVDTGHAVEWDGKGSRPQGF